MKRINVSDGTWFNEETATEYPENTYWNGNNHISLATGSQWDHELLYCTKGGAWVLHRWSQWQGSGASYERIGAPKAGKSVV